MLSTSHLLSAVKNKVGIMYHNKVERLFEFLKSHSSLLTWTDFGEAIVNGIHLPGTNVHEMLDYYFTIGENSLNNLHHKVWIS